MVSLLPVEPLDAAYLEELGFLWHTDSDESPYLADVLVQVTPEEAEAYYRAGNELYDMFVAAGEYVIRLRVDGIDSIPVDFSTTSTTRTT